MRVTIATLLVMWDIEPELDISYSQERLPEQVLGHQISHKTFNLQFVLPVRYVEVKVVQKLWEWPTSDWSSHERRPWADTI